MITRRKLLIAFSLGPLSAAFPSIAQQQAKVRRIGFLSVRSAPALVNADPMYKAFLEGMRDLGYVEGKNLVIDWRFGEGDQERLHKLAAELVRMKVEVIVTHMQGTGAAQKASRAIPIVSAITEDPVGAGFAAGLARPGGNITGLSQYTGDLAAKLLELLMIAVPKLSRVAVLTNPGNAAHANYLKAIQAAARKSKVAVIPVSARNPEEIDAGFAAITRERARAVIILPDAYYLQQVGQLAELAMRHRLPSIWGGRQFPDAGGLMSYGLGPAEDNYRRAAAFVDKILKGARAGDLPFEQPTRLYLVINRKSATALGLKIPQELLVRADEVIE